MLNTSGDPGDAKTVVRKLFVNLPAMLLLLVGATDKAGDYAKTTMKSLRQSKRPKITKPDFLGSRKTYL